MHIHFIQHVPFEYPASILDWAEQNHHTISYTKIFETVSFPSTETFNSLIIMGGPMGVYETSKYNWLQTEMDFIKAAINADKKVLGICLGAQLIARALCAEVYPHIHKEIGWWPVQKASQHKLTQQLPNAFTTFHWHGDIFELPKGAIQLFSSEACAQQGFALGNNILGLQFHIEVKEDLLYNMNEHERAELVKAAYVQTEDEINTLAPKYIQDQTKFMSTILDNFFV